jgi:hypothetical protein
MDLEVETDPGTLVTGDNNPSRQARAVPTRAAGMAGLGRTGQLTAAIRDPPSRKGPGQYLIVREGAHDTLASLNHCQPLPRHGRASGDAQRGRRFSTLCPGQLAFSRDALMRFARTLDAIFELMAIVRELLGHFVDPAGYIAADRRSENHGLTDLEFM